ncbi:MAG: hypothetical protein IT427_11480 [Pirellulales bacterium]|nr:hypothetical protein [Pirellulales bacterium]
MLSSNPFGRGIFTALATGVGVPVAVAVGVWLLMYVRAQRKAAGQPLLLDDERFQQLIDLLESLGEAQKKSSATRSSRSK